MTLSKLWAILAAIAMTLLSACATPNPGAMAKEPLSLKETQDLVTESTTRNGLIPSKTRVFKPVQLMTGQWFQKVETTDRSLFGDTTKSTSAFIESAPGSGVMVSAGTADVASKTGFQTIFVPAMTAVGVIRGASILSNGIVQGSNAVAGSIAHGSDTLAGAITEGAETTADGLTAVGDGLTSNAGGMTDMIGMMQCQALGNAVAIAQCIAALPH